MKIKDLSEEGDQKKEKHKRKCFKGIFIVVVIVIVVGLFVVIILVEKKKSDITKSTKVDSNLNSYIDKNECDSGYYLEKDTKICSICPAGTYSKKGAEECIKCPNGTYSSFNGASSCEECPAGKIPNKEKISCVDCQEEAYSNIKGASKCTSGPINTYWDEKGETEFKNCDSGLCFNHGSES